MRKFFYLFLLILFSCSSSDTTILVTNSGEAQGSYYHIKYMSENGEDYQFQIDSILQEVDSSLSIYKDYSLISKLNKGEYLKTDTLFNEVFLAAQKVFLESEGNFDCSISPLVKAWGFYKSNLAASLEVDSAKLKKDNLGDSLVVDSAKIKQAKPRNILVIDTLKIKKDKPKNMLLVDNIKPPKDNAATSFVIDSAKFRSILQDIGFQKIKLKGNSLIMPQNMSLDFNAIAQGFTVDLIARFLESKDIHNYLIEVGGELLAKGRNDEGNIWRVGVDKPLENIDTNERFQFILDLENKALATSGNYRKFYKKDGVKYSHVISPLTGFPAQNSLLSVTVIHDNCMLADAYATAFMVMGVAQTKQFVAQHSDIEIYLVYTEKDGNWKTYTSPKMLKRIIN